MSRSKTPLPYRLLWAVLALAQLSAVVVAPIVDAVLESGSPQVVHIESEAGDDCPSLHDHLFCQICRVIGVAGQEAPASCVATPRPQVRTHAGVVPEPGTTGSPGLFGPVASRAPPLA